LVEQQMNITVVHARSRAVAYLALTDPLVKRLGLIDIFNRHCQLAPQADGNNGIILTALTQARLAPTPVPLLHMPDWAEAHVIEALYGLPPTAFNDDACGRAIDAFYRARTQIWVDIVNAVHREFGPDVLDLRVLHSDVMLAQVEGQYADAPSPSAATPPAAQPCYGRTPKGFDSRRKQIGLSLSVTDQGIPCWWLAHDGNVSDPQVYEQHLFAVRTFFRQLHPIMVGDSKLPTAANRLAFNRAGAFYVGPASLRPEDTRTLRSLWADGVACERLDRPGQAQPDARPFWGVDHVAESTDPEQPQRRYIERTVFIFSQTERQAVRHARARALAKVRRALHGLTKQLNRGRYRSREYILRRLTALIEPVAAVISVALTEERDAVGKAQFRLRWGPNRQALRDAAEFDGWYRLLTNLPPASYSMSVVLRLYKGQSHVEGAFRQAKHWPIQVSPLWLHQPTRLEGLLGLTAIALLLTAVLAHHVRTAIAHAAPPPTGLQPEGRDHLPVTARRLWQIMTGIQLTWMTLKAEDGTTWQVAAIDTLTSAQETVLRLLGWPKPDEYLATGFEQLLL
jgi:transposase